MAEAILTQQVQQAIEAENLAGFIQKNLEGQKLSIRGVAGLCGVADKSIINGGSFNSQILAEKLESRGFDAGSLLENGFGAVETWLVIEYFAYDSKAKAPFAKAIARTFGAFGVKSAFSQVAPQPSSIPERATPAIDYITQGCEAAARFFGEAYAESMFAQNMRRHHPSLALPPVPAKERSSLPSTEALLIPRDIAKELGLMNGAGSPDSRAANALLKQLGYQESIAGQWQPTEKGQAFCTRKPVDTNSRTEKTQLLWYSSILKELKPLPVGCLS
jgi:hypothetical protein